MRLIRKIWRVDQRGCKTPWPARYNTLVNNRKILNNHNPNNRNPSLININSNHPIYRIQRPLLNIKCLRKYSVSLKVQGLGPHQDKVQVNGWLNKWDMHNRWSKQNMG